MSLQTTNFNRTYDETLDMIVEARNYMTYVDPRERCIPAERSDLRFSCEALRVTSRLTQVMAWLMLQRAVQDGEITQQDAMAEDKRLSGQDVCLDNESVDDGNLPKGLRDLLERSFRLYQRVSRLEAMVLSRLIN